MKTKFTLAWFLLALSVYRPIPVIAQVNEQDSLVLVDLYNSTNGPGWNHNTNWLTGPVSTWSGITVTDGRVTSIYLTFNAMRGPIPSSLGNLANLQELRLWDNALTGSIPSSLGNLVNLQDFRMEGNSLSGTIPSSLCNLINLQDLGLGGNQLSGVIPSSIGNLVNLHLLDLALNQLTGSIPSSLGNLVNLQYLFLNNDQLSGVIPSSIGNLVNLQDFDLYTNQLSGSIPSSIGNLINLQDFNLDNNQLSGGIPSSIGNLVNLQYLFLADNKLSDSIPHSIGNLVNLWQLDLSYNQLSDSIPSSIGNLVNLIYLWLGNNQLTGSIPSSIDNLVNLEDLYLSYNQLSGKIPNTLANLELSVELSYNHFTFDAMEFIAQTFLNATYYPQDSIPLHQDSDTLSVSAGGTLSNNTYHWYQVKDTGIVLIAAIKGDSVFRPAKTGTYFATITNSIATLLTLVSDRVFFDVTLPVTIIDFKAWEQKNIIKLDWTSLTETNVARYEIQRSSNGLNFSSIGALPANANGTLKADYTFDDLTPMEGANYYRLRIIDKDGKIVYSKTVLVITGNDDPVTIIYPNPAKDILHIQTNSTGAVSLIDQSGKILLTTNINGSGSINVSGFANGLYYLKNNTSEAVQKVVIER